MALVFTDIIDFVKNISPEGEVYEFRNQLTITIPKRDLLEVCHKLKTMPEMSFDMLTDVTAIDFLRDEDRFELVYFLYSHKYKSRLRLKVKVSEQECEALSVTSIWESANWYERETYDMYGVRFAEHPDLRRFYMPEDYNNPHTGEPIYPLRKDFPLMGIPDSIPLPPYPEKYGE